MLYIFFSLNDFHTMTLAWCPSRFAKALLIFFVLSPARSRLSIPATDDDNLSLLNGHLPTLFILGVQKGGSSSLYEHMVNHPYLCGGDRHKEAHFFDHDDDYQLGRQFYAGMYTDEKCGTNQNARYIDGTPMMYYTSKVAPRIASLYTDVERNNLKFIVLLREPVSRDYSWYQHVVRANLADGMKFKHLQTFEEMDRENIELINHIHRAGKYAEQLQRLTDFFRRDQILVLNSALAFQNTSRMMDSIAQFLSIEKIPQWDEPLPHDDHLEYPRFEHMVNCLVTHVPAIGCNFRDEVCPLEKPIPFNYNFYFQILLPSFITNHIVLEFTVASPPFSFVVLSQLGNFYDIYNMQLYEWIRGSVGEAPPSEPYFEPFEDAYRNISCVPNAREFLDAMVKESDYRRCSRRHADDDDGDDDGSGDDGN